MKRVVYLRYLVLLILAGLLLANFQTAQAAALTAVSDKMTRLKKSTAANHTIVFTTPTGIAVGNTVTLTFAAGFDITAVVLADVTIGGNAPASAVVGGQVLTITADADTTVAAAGIATIVITNNHITNPATAGSYTVSIAGTFGDSGSYAAAIADEDQVVVTASVDPYLSFNVTDGTAALGTLSITTIKTDATPTMTALTNSTLGYSITVSGATLTNGGFTIIAITAGCPAASAPGTEQFGIKLAAAGGSGAVDADYSGNYCYKGAAAPDVVASSAGVSDTTTYTMTYMANIANITEPGAYTATHTYIATGNF